MTPPDPEENTPIYDETYLAKQRAATGRAIVNAILTIGGILAILWLPVTMVWWSHGSYDWTIIISGIVSAMFGLVLVSLGQDRHKDDR